MSAITEIPQVPRSQEPEAKREHIFDLFRRWGYLEADLDPLKKSLQAARYPELDPKIWEDGFSIRCNCSSIVNFN